jgi:alpha-N-arabinofuranosidase
MNHSHLTLHPSFVIDKVDPRVFGGFLEHLGRAVYQGVYEPGSAHADSRGFRQDVLAALRKLEFTAMRYPGGNFVSGYDWVDGIGPRSKRPTKRDLAWQSLDTNEFGTDEFMQMSREMGWTPMFAVNLGTGTPSDARNWLEYCNGELGTYWADMRAANGSPEPHNIGLWCLGNEMDGPWQIGHVPAEEYAIRAQQTARLMKMFDPKVELVLCGSCATNLPTYLDWDRKVLEYCYQDVDYISLHSYVGNPDDKTADFLTVGLDIDKQIEDLSATCRFVQGKLKTRKQVHLSFDEWNVWYRARTGEHVDGKAKFAAPLLEEVYNLEDALVVAQFLNSFIRHADTVKIANIAQIVNVIAPIMTRGDDLLIQSIFYPFEMMSSRRNGVALQVGYSGPKCPGTSHPDAPQVDASAILDGGKLSVFLVNRSMEEQSEVCIELGQHKFSRVESAEIVTGHDPKAANRLGEEPVVQSKPFDEICFTHGTACVTLPPMSFVAATLH